MKITISWIIFLSTVLITGCPEIIVQPETQIVVWIATLDINGDNLEYICKSEGAIPNFVPDLENPGEELILLDYGNRIDCIKQDGTERRTIIDSIGSLYNFSQDKTKMLLNYEGEIYIANVDGTGLENITNTDDIIELDPSFSNDNQYVVYCYTNIVDSLRVIAIYDINENTSSTILEENYSEWMYYVSPVINNNWLYFGQNDPDYLNTDGLYKMDLISQEKITIDYGHIHSNVIFSLNEKISFRNSYILKIYNINGNEIIDLGEHSYISKPNFNFTGEKLAIESLIIDTSTYENYNILDNYSQDEVSHTDYTLDFNLSSTKVVMNVKRYYP